MDQVAPTRERPRPPAQQNTNTVAPINLPGMSTAPVQPGARTGGIANSDIGWMKSGSHARAIMDDEIQRAQIRAEERARQRLIPWRYWAKTGTQGHVIILDRVMGPSFFEHDLKNNETGRYDVHEACPKEWEVCPLCEGAAGAKASTFNMFLTVIDCRPYVDRNGVNKPWTQKLLVVRPQQQGFFHRLAERHQGNLRGVCLLMARDNKNAPSIGNPEEVAKYTEEQLVATFSHPAVTDQQGKVIKPANSDLIPVRYGEVFQRPSGDDLRRRYGGQAPLGSAGYGNDDGWGGYNPNAGGGAINLPGMGGVPVHQGSGPIELPQGTATSYEDMDDEIPF